ncbi:MAG: hypothetical protein LBE65_01075, partial [Synergistaceae bacterium]|nr:hypothetical protein [Synergistaceae bacterium]
PRNFPRRPIRVFLLLFLEKGRGDIFTVPLRGDIIIVRRQERFMGLTVFISGGILTSFVTGSIGDGWRAGFSLGLS